jgi:hypothetical protein
MAPVIWSPLPSHPRWSTVLMAAVVLAVVTWRTRRPLLACLAVLAWLSAYEIAWNTCSLVTHGDDPVKWFWLVLALLAWPLLAHQVGLRPQPVAVALCAAGFAIWLVLGFDYNWMREPGPVRVLPEVLNVLTKTVLGVAYLAGALAAPAVGPRLGGPARAPAQTQTR